MHSKIFCTIDCAYQKHGYCMLDLPTTTGNPGCVYRISVQDASLTGSRLKGLPNIARTNQLNGRTGTVHLL